MCRFFLSRCAGETQAEYAARASETIGRSPLKGVPGVPFLRGTGWFDAEGRLLGYCAL